MAQDIPFKYPSFPKANVLVVARLPNKAYTRTPGIHTIKMALYLPQRSQVGQRISSPAQAPVTQTVGRLS